ncbi:MAG: glycosyltransferase family 61 protein [Marmoricola sp.]
MSRLPTRLQPLWPLAKRAHRRSTSVLGPVYRRTSRLAAHPLPRTASTSADETALGEPGSVRLHPGGPGEQLRRTPPVGQPAGHWNFAANAAYDVPRRFTLEITGGSVVGDYAAHLTPGGVLDYETSGYFGIDGWRQHPLFLRRRLPDPTPVDGTVVSLATRGSSANYYHFLLDVLPRLGVLRECLPDELPDAWYLNTGTSYQRRLLDLIGLGDVPVLEASKHAHVRAQRLLVPCIPNPDLMAPHWTTDWLRHALPPRDLDDRPRRLYVTRGDRPNTRRLVDEARLLPVLERYGFVRFDPGEHDVQDQIDSFAAAEAIVAPHGAALANLVFCRPGVRVLELFAPTYVNPCYWVIADNVPQSRYRYLVGSGRAPRAGSPMTGVLTDITVSERSLAAAVDDLLA